MIITHTNTHWFNWPTVKCLRLIFSIWNTVNTKLIGIEIKWIWRVISICAKITCQNRCFRCCDKNKPKANNNPPLELIRSEFIYYKGLFRFSLLSWRIITSQVHSQSYGYEWSDIESKTIYNANLKCIKSTLSSRPEASRYCKIHYHPASAPANCCCCYFFRVLFWLIKKSYNRQCASCHTSK